MKTFSVFLLIMSSSLVNAQGNNVQRDTIALTESYVCDTLIKMGNTEIYISIEPTRLIKWNYWTSNGVQGCNWKYELRYHIESNRPMYTLQGTINNTNFFDLPNSGCSNGCTGLVYTANNSSNDCANVDFDMSDIIRIQIQNTDISYRNVVLNCGLSSSLPVELVSFSGFNENRTNKLSWTTATELNNDYFLLERTQNGQNWEFVSIVEGAGTTSEKQHYFYSDYAFTAGVNYYRLVQTDFDGKRNISEVISIDNTNDSRTLERIVNLLGETVNEDYSGMKIYVYSNGDILKKY
ncbi:MAG: hypothetical protein ACFHU9_05685 [Fluviicola sp.]